jgi:hypothetical protein
MNLDYKETAKRVLADGEADGERELRLDSSLGFF